MTGPFCPRQEVADPVLTLADDLAAIHIPENMHNGDSLKAKRDGYAMGNKESTEDKRNGDIITKEHPKDSTEADLDINVRKPEQNRGSIAQGESILQHWSFGGSLPDTLQLRSDPSRGEGLFARRAISVLEPICSPPYTKFMAIETEKLQTTCYSCLIVTASHVPRIKGAVQEDVNLKSCSGCYEVRFCSKECQVLAWRAYHKHECKIFKKYRHNFPPMLLRAAMRMILLQDRGLLSRTYWNKLMNELVSHENVWKALPENNTITDMVRDIEFVTKSRLSRETITRLFWAMKTNSIELPTSVHGGIGVMLEPLFSKFNHSCEANAMLYRPWHTSSSGWNLESNTELTLEQRTTFATVIPLRDIKQGEELTICYSDPTMSVKERNAKHKRSYYFECACSKCKGDLEAANQLELAQPGLLTTYETWSEGLLGRLEVSQGGTGGLPRFDAVTEAFESGIARYLDYPELLGASAFDQITLHLAYYGLEWGAFDNALINFLRPYFLVYPSRLAGRHNYFNIHILFILIEVFDILLDINCKGPVDDIKPGDVKQSLRALSERGLGKETLIYWRQRICNDLRTRLEASAARDLLPLVAQLQERLPLGRAPFSPGADDSMVTTTDAGNVLKDPSAEMAMRYALQLSEARWKVVLAETGC